MALEKTHHAWYQKGATAGLGVKVRRYQRWRFIIPSLVLSDGFVRALA